jgi:isoleucyl-tRNA synthetase
LPANKGLAIGEGIDYSIIEKDGDFLIVAKALVESIREKGVLEEQDKEVQAVSGKDLIVLIAEHPFIEHDDLKGKRHIFGTNFVSTEEGTGVVHIAPGHGQEDYQAWLENKEKLGDKIYAPVNKYGKFEGTGNESLDGQFVFKANSSVIDILKEKDALLGEGSLAHSYPHCWRCKKPVIFRATEQWFISMEHEELRKKSLEEVNKAHWIPEWGKDRIYGMIENRPDWCISRQRSWGVPIAVLKCSSCREMVNDDRANELIIKEFTGHGADVWYTKDAGDFLPAGFKCQCGSTEFEKETDILDVWFDSGVSHAATLIPERGLGWPADMYLEGSDQHRGWFQSSMLASVGTRGTAPYRTVLTHGYTVDGQGKKMSKSLGNVIAPQDVIKKTGADILRLWVSAEDYRGDVRISGEILARLTEAYRKIRNTAKYLLGNLHDFDGGDYSGDLLEIDRWAMSQLQHLIMNVTDAYENFTFHEVYHRLHHFCIVDMSSFYLDILKDRLYTFRADSKERRAAQWVLNEILHAMTRLMAPVLSFTSDEIWRHIENRPEKSVFLARMPVPEESLIDDELETRWAQIIKFRDEVNKALEEKRREKFIGNSLEARVLVHTEDEETRGLLKRYEPELPTIFIVSQASLSESPGGFKSDEIQGLSVEVDRAEGGKCARCWNRSLTVGTIKEAPDICGRCHKAIS